MMIDDRIRNLQVLNIRDLEQSLEEYLSCEELITKDPLVREGGHVHLGVLLGIPGSHLAPVEVYYMTVHDP